MARKTPTILAAAETIGEARRRIRERLCADGQLCEADASALLLLDIGIYQVNKADIDRRRAHGIEDVGEAADQVLRDERRLDRDWAHVVQHLATQTR